MIKRIVFLVNFHILLINVLAAQLNVVATGGDAQANSGAISYSVGQIDYTSVTMQSGSVAQGLQHPFQATIVTDVKLFDGLSFARIYPNPFSTSFSMNIESEIVNGLNYQVLDVFGRILKSEAILTNSTIIDLPQYADGIYLLTIYQNGRRLKTFQVLKLN